MNETIGYQAEIKIQITARIGGKVEVWAFSA